MCSYSTILTTASWRGAFVAATRAILPLVPHRMDAFGLDPSGVWSGGRSSAGFFDDPVKVVLWLHTPGISLR
jgi:hypothetical protein